MAPQGAVRLCQGGQHGTRDDQRVGDLADGEGVVPVALQLSDGPLVKECGTFLWTELLIIGYGRCWHSHQPLYCSIGQLWTGVIGLAVNFQIRHADDETAHGTTFPLEVILTVSNIPQHSCTDSVCGPFCRTAVGQKCAD